MWPWSKQKRSVPNEALRETLFGDVPLSAWGAGAPGEPWASFSRAAVCLGQGDRAGGIDSLRSIVQTSGLESRHYLEAWCSLREAGIAPAADEAKHLYGVVVDVPMNTGLDTLAAYEDRGARYINCRGTVIIWEAPDSRLDGHIHTLLAAGQKLVGLIGPWESTRPPLPPRQARISLLTPSGLHFGQAPLAALTQDGMAAPVIQAATELMQALVKIAEASRGTA
jgi:hypothetical protein